MSRVATRSDGGKVAGGPRPAPETAALWRLLADGPNRGAVAGMVRGWADDLGDLIVAGKFRKLRSELQALLLVAEALIALDEKVGGIALDEKVGGKDGGQ